METSFVIQGLIVYCLVFTSVVLASEIDEEAGEGNATQTTGFSANSSWSCPQGWVPYSGDNGLSCFLLDKTTRSFRAATAHCRELGGGLVTFLSPEKETFVKALAKSGEGGDHWVGLSKDPGYDDVFQWHTLRGTVKADEERLPQAMKDYVRFKAQCTYLSSFSEELDMDECEAEYFGICERNTSCKPGYFGNKCEKECHCAGELCNPSLAQGTEGVVCKWGCQRNWMGAACDSEKQDPEVKYFCVNSPGEIGKYVHIRIYTNGIQYRAIYGLTAQKTRAAWCSSTTYESTYSANDLTIIRIPVDDNSIEQMSSGMCAGQRLAENIFSWSIVIKENEGILLDHDLLVNITCDFNQAENLVRSDQYSLDGEPRQVHQVSFTQESIQDDVTLNLVSAYSGDQVTEANVGTSVILQMKFGLQKGSLLKGVFPYNCVASSPDGEHVKQLLNENGCQVPNSPLQPFVLSGDRKVVTPWFSLFAFEDEQTVTFRCSFELCFTPNCKSGCWTPPRLRRDTQERKDDVQHSTTRTIRVLPSIPSQKTSGNMHHNMEYQAPASAGYEFGPFVYLNPVTCTLFLLILLIFLCMYIAFLRTLRKSVYDIRKEIEVKRSRDKFLHCGCVQQKDRDYIKA